MSPAPVQPGAVAHGLPFPTAKFSKLNVHAFDPTRQAGRVQPRPVKGVSNVARAVREHARGRHFG